MLLAAMALMAAAAASPAADARPICQNDAPHAVERSSTEAPLRRLDQLPPANLVRTVLRAEDGCSTPEVVRYGIGAPEKAGN